MAEYDNTNTGALFKNTKKETDQHPDYTGEINVKGTEQRIAAWLNTSKSGLQYLSIKCSDPMPKEETGQPAAAEPAKMDDTIPF